MAKIGDRLLSTREAKKVLGVDWGTIYKYISSGKLQAHKLGGNGKSKRHWRIWESDLLSFVNSNSNVKEQSK